MKNTHFWFLFFLTAFIMAQYLPKITPSAYNLKSAMLATPVLLVVLLITLLIGKILIIAPKQVDQNNLNQFSANYSNDQIALVFDLHGVVFRFDPILAAKIGLQTNQKKLLICAALNPFLIWDVFKLLYKSLVVEQAIMAINHKYPKLKPIIPLALQMANTQVPIQPTVDLIQELKKAGFKLFVFSNIGEQSAQILQTKYPEIFSLFDGILVTTAQDNYLMKPDRAAFDKFLNKFKLTKSQMIFIDDKQSNIYIAKKMGICSIQFIHANQCKQMLQKKITAYNYE